ncbi:MAG TPA: hypothetical protein VFH27_18580, partial [Longimicrobiaceae bacterium]|nr:hypothetical protein [Longimicrobiaceae bacterium]
MAPSRSLALAVGLAVTGCAPAAMRPAGSEPAAAPTGTTAALPSSNPFYAVSTLAFQTPDFSRIRNEDYQPAFEAGMRQHTAEIEAIANNPAAPTFDNTVVQMERSGTLLTRVSKVFFALTQANT